ncbi:hypothetical protein LguiA_020079 [Lonicera macranthoides]
MQAYLSLTKHTCRIMLVFHNLISDFARPGVAVSWALAQTYWAKVQHVKAWSIVFSA